jgi:hypothetical protein
MAKLPLLTQLDLSTTNIETAWVKVIATFPKLLHLTIEECDQVTSIKQLRDCTTLRTLKVGDCSKFINRDEDIQYLFERGTWQLEKLRFNKLKEDRSLSAIVSSCKEKLRQLDIRQSMVSETGCCLCVSHLTASAFFTLVQCTGLLFHVPLTKVAQLCRFSN